MRGAFVPSWIPRQQARLEERHGTQENAKRGQTCTYQNLCLFIFYALYALYNISCSRTANYESGLLTLQYRTSGPPSSEFQAV